MKVLSTDGLTKLIELIKAGFISVSDTEQTSEVTLATVATTGAYSDLSGKPTIPTDTSDLTNGAGYITGVAWGGITGTLSNQTDLSNALAGKADDTAVVKLAGAQTITGDKTFSGTISVATPLVSDNSTKPATTAYIETKFQVVASLPATPDANTFYFIEES